MAENYEFDSVDKAIIRELLEDARTPYLEIARKIKVSGGTIHQRIDRLKSLGVIEGTRLRINHQKIGLGVSVLIGIHLKNAKDYKAVVNNLEMFDEVVQVFYTTGSYALIIKVLIKDVSSYHYFLVHKLQNVSQIQSTETFLCLDTPIDREVII